QSAGLVQQAIIDPEGDFASLADRYGHVWSRPTRDVALQRTCCGGCSSRAPASCSRRSSTRRATSPASPTATATSGRGRR
ncbi:hypothetical protein CTI14_68445, partial [Methylobacterium radiotolerans]